MASNGALWNENRQMFSNLLCESEEFVKEPENAMTDKVHDDELNLLHEICDGDIALHSVKLAIQVCCDLSYQSGAQMLRLPLEIIVDKSQWQTLPPSELNNQAIELRMRFENLGHIGDLEKAIEMQRYAIVFTPLHNVTRPIMLGDLGTSYQRRFERFGEVKDIDSAITQQLKAVVSIPLNHLMRPAILTNSGCAYLQRYKRFGERKDIESAVDQQLKAAASLPLNSVYRPDISRNLGDSYQCRFLGFGDIQDLKSAIKHWHDAVASMPLNHPNRHMTLNNLGMSYQLRFERLRRQKDIDSAIKHLLEAVDSVPPDSPNKARYLNNLGNAYNSRVTRFEELNDIASSINQPEALGQTLLPNTANSAERDTSLHSSGISYRSHFGRAGHMMDMDSAIERHLEAVASIPPDSPERPEFLNDLGTSYGNRHLRFGEVKDIDLSIKYQLEAVASTPLESSKRAELLNNLGISYNVRFNRFGEIRDINSSIKRLLEAVSSTPLDIPEHLIYQSNLGNAYADRFKHSRDVKDIDLGIKEQLKAVTSIAIDSRDRSRLLHHLGGSYLECFGHSRDVKDLELAIQRQLEASASIKSTIRPGFYSYILGILYICRFGFSREVKDIDFAIEKLVEAAATTPRDSADRPLFLYSLGHSYNFRKNQPTDLEESISNFRLSSLSLKGLPSLRIMGSLHWACLAHKGNNLVSASEAYDQAFRLLPQVAWIGLNAIAQLKELESNSDIQTLGCNAAACMIALAQVQAEHHNRQRHLGRAIELLEQGRSILWSQTSNFKQDLDDLRKVDSNLASNLDNVGKILSQGCFRDPNDPLSESDAQLYRRYAEKWEDLVRRIRDLPGFDHFLLPLPISTLRTAAAEGPVVIINSSEYRCDVVIVPSQGDLVLVPLSNITAAKLEKLASLQVNLVSRQTKPACISSKHMPSEILLNQIWSFVGEPIAQKFKELGLVQGSEAPLSSKNRVWWCLTGSLSFLPIHASFPPTKPGISSIGMMDIVISSYTPTISTLLRAQQRNKLKRPTFRMLAVGQSSIVLAGMKPLPGVKEEIAFIQETLGVDAVTLDESKATVDRVAASLPTCSWAHFACHGVQDSEKPMDSGLVMWDCHRLTLSHLAQSSLASAEFAFLSCCESAKGSKQFPNEAMHLAAGLQFIGYRGVIGTMWSVGDKDALSIAKQVYGELFKDGTGQVSASKAALALHQAILLLRANNVPLVRWVPFVHFGL